MDIHDIEAINTIEYMKKCFDAEQKDASDSDSESEVDEEVNRRKEHRERYYYIGIGIYVWLFYMMYWSFMDVYRSRN